MNLEELRSVQDAERHKSGLQPLRESFYEEAGEYIADLKRERERAADRADDPFSSTEVRQISDEIDTAEDVLEAIYERRMGKLLERASLAAAEMAVDDEGLTAEERELFEDLVDRISRNKSRVLETLAGEPDAVGGRETASGRPTGESGGESPGNERSPDDGPSNQREPDRGEPAATETGGTARDPGSARGESDDAAGDGRHEVDPDPPPEAIRESAGGDRSGDPGGDGTGGPGDGDGAGSRTVESDRESGPATQDPIADGDVPDPIADGDGGRAAPDRDRVTVRITDDVGAIYGVDDREYDLSSDDVVALPEANADPLVERGAAEPLDRP